MEPWPLTQRGISLEWEGGWVEHIACGWKESMRSFFWCEGGTGAGKPQRSAAAFSIGVHILPSVAPLNTRKSKSHDWLVSSAFQDILTCAHFEMGVFKIGLVKYRKMAHMRYRKCKRIAKEEMHSNRESQQLLWFVGAMYCYKCREQNIRIWRAFLCLRNNVARVCLQLCPMWLFCLLSESVLILIFEWQSNTTGRGEAVVSPTFYWEEYIPVCRRWQGGSWLGQ